MNVQAELLTEIEAFLAHHGRMAETTFGRLAVNDGKFVGRLREGANMTLATIERTRQFISDQRALESTGGAIAEAAPDRLAREAQRLFAAALRQARLQYGRATGQGEITQRQFAMMLDIDGERPEERYRLYEAGKREPPLWILAALRRVTGYSLDGLIAQLPAGRRLEREPSASGERVAAE